MSATDEAHVDFMHVSTYIPVVFQLLRVSVFLTLLEAVVRVQQHFAMLIALTAFITYLDGRVFYTERLNRACGFLIPTGLVFCVNKAVFVQFATCSMSHATLVVYYVLSTAWATCGLGMLGMLSIDTLADVQSRVSSHTFILVSGGLGVANVYMDCHVKPMYELLIRVGLFYLFTTSFILLHWTSQRTHHTVYESIGKHITMHILFVDFYVVIGSVALFILFHLYVIQSRRQKKAPGATTFTACTGTSSLKPDAARPPAQRAPSAAPGPSDDSVLHELIAAKRAINMV